MQEPLGIRGFHFDGHRTFRRAVGRGVIQIINLQLGERSLQGMFTVNLAVYVPGESAQRTTSGLCLPEKIMEFHCVPDRRRRLGTLVPRRLEALQTLPLIGLFFVRRDMWWRCSRHDITATSLSSVLDALEKYGLDWLDGATPIQVASANESTRQVDFQ